MKGSRLGHIYMPGAASSTGSSGNTVIIQRRPSPEPAAATGTTGSIASASLDLHGRTSQAKCISISLGRTLCDNRSGIEGIHRACRLTAAITVGRFPGRQVIRTKERIPRAETAGTACNKQYFVPVCHVSIVLQCSVSQLYRSKACGTTAGVSTIKAITAAVKAAFTGGLLGGRRSRAADSNIDLISLLQVDISFTVAAISVFIACRPDTVQ